MIKVEEIRDDIDQKFTQFAFELEQAPNNGHLHVELNKLETDVFKSIDKLSFSVKEENK